MISTLDKLQSLIKFKASEHDQRSQVRAWNPSLASRTISVHVDGWRWWQSDLQNKNSSMSLLKRLYLFSLDDSIASPNAIAL